MKVVFVHCGPWYCGAMSGLALGARSSRVSPKSLWAGAGGRGQGRRAADRHASLLGKNHPPGRVVINEDPEGPGPPRVSTDAVSALIYASAAATSGATSGV
ncbi:unnamed protein product [Lota lota]